MIEKQPSQSDYFQATKGGGHGDYRLIVLAPSSVQEMYDFVKLGFDLSFKYRNPAMILTVTVGIVSHKKRTVGMNVHENFIQTDASINPGNSGGPLLNLEGRVIGVNDFIISPSAGNIGLSFAIDGNLSKKISGELLAHGKIERPWIGVSMAEISAQHKKMLNLKSGVAAVEIIRGAPAHRAGVKADDVIVTVDGKPVNQPGDVQNAILDHKPGEMMKMTVCRENRMLDVTVQTEAMPSKRFGALR